MKNNIKLILIILLSTCLTACGKTTTIRHHKDYKEHLSKNKVMTILPPSVEVVTIEASGKVVRNYNYESLVEEIVVDVLRQKLSQLGYKVNFINRREIHNQKISHDILNLKEEYFATIGALYKPIMMDEEKAKDINIFLKKSLKETDLINSSNLLVVAEYNLRAKSSGACTKDFAVAVFASALGASVNQDPAELLSLRLAIIDPYNGQFIWSNYNSSGYSSISNFGSDKSPRSIESKRLSALYDNLISSLKIGK